MMKKQIDINTIPAEKLQFAQEGVKLADKKLQTKPRGYFKDAWIRFKKNKSSVVAVCIIAFLILYAIVAPLLTPYTLDDRDNRYLNRPGYVYGSEWLGDGCKQTEIGECDNQIVYVAVYDESSGKRVDVTGSYEILCYYGTLTVTMP